MTDDSAPSAAGLFSFKLYLRYNSYAHKAPEVQISHVLYCQEYSFKKKKELNGSKIKMCLHLMHV